MSPKQDISVGGIIHGVKYCADHFGECLGSGIESLETLPSTPSINLTETNALECGKNPYSMMVTYEGVETCLVFSKGEDHRQRRDTQARRLFVAL